MPQQLCTRTRRGRSGVRTHKHTSTHLGTLENWPAGHAWQEVLSAALAVPAGQGKHTVEALTGVYVPAAHSGQLEAPAAEVVPGTQGRQMPSCAVE